MIRIQIVLHRVWKVLVTASFLSARQTLLSHLSAAGTASEITSKIILEQTGRSPNEPVEERDFDEFFERLTVVREWYGEEEKARAKKFLELYTLLKESLQDRKVFRIGRIQLEIFAVGLDRECRLTGVSTSAVQT